jgi:KDO2-lipid IV(A) lauroyltransferase
VARSKSRLQINLEYYPVSWVWRLLSVLPSEGRLNVSWWVLRAILLFIPKRIASMRSNLRQSFPEKSAEECNRIADDSVRNIARGLAAFARLPPAEKIGQTDWIVGHGVEHLRKAAADGKGAITFTAHYGCWEVLPSFIMHHAKKGGIVLRPLDNPKLETLIARTRSVSGSAMIPRNNMLRQGLRLLHDKGVLGILIDQNFAPGGVFVDFFGRLAATAPIVSILARRTGAVALPTHTRWIENKVHVFIEPPLPLSDDPDLDIAMAKDTLAMNQAIERWIREDPTQWLWLHNRWKRRPEPGELIYPIPEGTVRGSLRQN